MDAIFKITDLSCSYAADLPVVLKINELNLERGKLIFLIGASGTGKSTLLETLGLMNNTIGAGDVYFTPNHVGSFDYLQLWKQKDEHRISEIRKQHFNFIFQNTNLMENFTAYENVCLSGMIKGSKTGIEVIDGVKELMNRVRLPENEVGSGTLAINLSGGQRQRLAFVRALSAKSTVLLCDEPTGNLDEANANELFQVIRESLKDGLTAIVVSHDIDIAVKHADQIVLLTKDPANTYGEIHSANIYNRKYWIDFTEKETEQFKEKIRSTFVAGADKSITASAINQNHQYIGAGFRKLFMHRESAALAGKNYSNLIIITAIFLFTFIAIGFGNGSLNYLNTKLKSAFVNWLTINIPLSKSSGDKALKEIIDNLNQPELRAMYAYDSVTSFKITNIQIWDPVRKDSFWIKGRTFDFLRDRKYINEEVVSKKNRVMGEGFRYKEDLSVIVKKEWLASYGYPPNAEFIEMQFPITGSDSTEIGTRRMLVGIRAIVEELPGRVSFACTEYFYQAFLLGYQSPFNIAQQADKLIYYLQTDSAEAGKIAALLQKFVDSSAAYQSYLPNPIEAPVLHESSHGSGYDLTISFFSMVRSYKTMDSLHEEIMRLGELKPYNNRITRVYNYNNVKEGAMSALSYDMLSVYFNDLERVRDFSDYVKETFNDERDIASQNIIMVDITKVQDKENYNFLSKITFIISYLIIIFGSVAVSLFIFNLLKMHLNKIKMNIGTFMAIGLDNRQTRSIYFTIIVSFVFISILVSFMLAYLIGFGINEILTSKMNIEQDVVNYFNLFDWNTLVAFFIFIGCCFLVAYSTINKMLSKSPGDLIYNR